MNRRLRRNLIRLSETEEASRKKPKNYHLWLVEKQLLLKPFSSSETTAATTRIISFWVSLFPLSLSLSKSLLTTKASSLSFSLWEFLEWRRIRMVVRSRFPFEAGVCRRRFTPTVEFFEFVTVGSGFNDPTA